jgi:hypothetical protein
MRRPMGHHKLKILGKARLARPFKKDSFSCIVKTV